MKLSRKIGHRKSLIKNLVTSLILYEKMITTSAKAKSFLADFEKVINLAKPQTLSARRRILGFLKTKSAVDKVFDVLVPRYKNFNSGYAKTYNLGRRPGDNAPLVLIKLILPAVSETPSSKIEKKVSKDEKSKRKTKQQKSS